MLFEGWMILVSSCFITLANGNVDSAEVDSSREKEVQYVYVSGKVYPPDNYLGGETWQRETQVHLRGSNQRGFIREDGSFVFTYVQPGSYIVEVTSPNYFYEPIRVEITAKGKIRARKVNYIQASQVFQVPYPLKLRPLGQTRYFQIREQWRITDLLLNPMVLMTVLPLVVFMLLPKMMNDPEARKEMEQLSNFTKYDFPEMSEVMTSIFGSGAQQKARSRQANKKGNKNS